MNWFNECIKNKRIRRTIDCVPGAAMIDGEEQSLSFHKKEKFKEKVIANAAEDALKRKKRWWFR